MSTSLSFPLLRILFIAIAFLATFVLARQVVQVAPTSDMINYISELFEHDRVWREDDDQLRNLSENTRAGDTRYFYRKETDLELYFTYTVSEGSEFFGVYCITEWGAGHLKAEFDNSVFIAGTFNDQALITGKNTALQAKLGSVLKSIRLITRSQS